MMQVNDAVSPLGVEEIVQGPASSGENPVPPAVTLIVLPVYQLAGERVMAAGAANTVKESVENFVASALSVTLIVDPPAVDATETEKLDVTVPSPFMVQLEVPKISGPAVTAIRQLRVPLANPPPKTVTIPSEVPNPIGALVIGVTFIVGGGVDTK